MKKKEVRDLIFEGLNGILGEHEFRQNKKDSRFARKIPGGEQRIVVAIWDYSPEYQFSLGITVRIDAIEAVIARSFGTNYTIYPDDAATTLTKLDYLLGTKHHRYEVRSAEDIAAVLKELVITIKEKIIPFLDGLTTSEAVERLINADTTRFEHHAYPRKATTGIAAASLANPANFEAIAERYGRELTALNFNKMDFDQVRKLIVDLRAELQTKKQVADH